MEAEGKGERLSGAVTAGTGGAGSTHGAEVLLAGGGGKDRCVSSQYEGSGGMLLPHVCIILMRR